MQKIPANAPVLAFATSKYACQADHPEIELSFPARRDLDIYEIGEDGWWTARLDGKEGIVPRDYLQPTSPLTTLVHVIRTHCACIPNIFREQVDPNDLNKLENLFSQFESQHVQLVNFLAPCPPHVLAGFLKKTLKTSQTPILPSALYNTFIAMDTAYGGYGFDAAQISQSFASALNTPQHLWVAAIFHMLATIQTTPRQMLAYTFGPFVLRPDVETMETMTRHQKIVNGAVLFIIEHVEDIFGIKVDRSRSRPHLTKPPPSKNVPPPYVAPAPSITTVPPVPSRTMQHATSTTVSIDEPLLDLNGDWSMSPTISTSAPIHPANMVPSIIPLKAAPVPPARTVFGAVALSESPAKKELTHPANTVPSTVPLKAAPVPPARTVFGAAALSESPMKKAPAAPMPMKKAPAPPMPTKEALASPESSLGGAGSVSHAISTSAPTHPASTAPSAVPLKAAPVPPARTVFGAAALSEPLAKNESASATKNAPDLPMQKAPAPPMKKAPAPPKKAPTPPKRRSSLKKGGPPVPPKRSVSKMHGQRGPPVM